ncbi:RNA polymerase sigma factor [Nonomuraea wenchangensis]|uniref:RNA polymerase sigma-70 factor, ECF subfamily n=1 Tax=Nonomuraea wenchangensis TaxID=568860 RepID=A0A1I0LNH7_9ACTN|nr:RNA polymerase sigma factor [Nonomuraea wenchangensis]SEU42885.1 RNA polymerase sigma-70 factor, ECF subfamily [Nonomuraea wenchangensis]
MHEPYLTAPPDDAVWIERSWDEPECFGAVFDVHYAEIHRYVSRRLGPQAADDVSAETFALAFRRRRRFDLSHRSARPWLYGIATNLISRHRRDEVRLLRAVDRLHALAEPARGHEDEVTAKVSAQNVKGPLAGAIAALPAAQRDVLLLVALAGLSYDEVAQALDVPFGTVSSRLNRARRKLRKALGETNPLLDEEEA